MNFHLNACSDVDNDGLDNHAGRHGEDSVHPVEDSAHLDNNYYLGNTDCLGNIDYYLDNSRCWDSTAGLDSIADLDSIRPCCQKYAVNTK